MKIALNGQQLAASHSLAEIIAVAKSLDVSALELWPANISGGNTDEERERYETKSVAATAQLLKDSGITVACVTLGFWALPMCFKRGGAVACTEALIGAVDAAQTLGAGLVNCYMTRMATADFVAAARPAAEYATARDIVITLENEAHDEAATVRNVAQIVRAVDSPGLATQYDPCNYYHANEEAYPDAYEVLRPHIAYVHLKGGCLFHEDRAGVHQGSLMRDSETQRIGYLPLPDAAFGADAILRRLVKDGYNGFVTLEPHVPAEYVRAFYEAELPFVRSFLP